MHTEVRYVFNFCAQSSRAIIRAGMLFRGKMDFPAGHQRYRAIIYKTRQAE